MVCGLDHSGSQPFNYAGWYVGIHIYMYKSVYLIHVYICVVLSCLWT